MLEQFDFLIFRIPVFVEKVPGQIGRIQVLIPKLRTPNLKEKKTEAKHFLNASLEKASAICK